MTGFSDNFITYCRQIILGIRHLKHFRLSSIGKVFSLMGRKEKITVYLLAIIAIANLGVSSRNFYYAHTVLTPTVGGLYTEGLMGQPIYLNPLLAHSDVDTALSTLIFSGLYKYDEQGHLIPDLADGQPVISDDQKQYIINLKRNVKWHNDKPFSADDVVFTIQTVKDPAYKSPLRTAWSNVSADKINDYQVKFSTQAISAQFIYNLTLPMLPKSVWGSVDPQRFTLSETNLQAVGTGPYVVKEIKKQKSGKIDQITLDSFSNYYFGKPRIDTLLFKFYDNNDDILNALHSKEIGSLGFVALDQNLFIDQDRAEVQMLKLPLPQYQVVFFNLNNKILNDLSVRSALFYATNRNEIITQVFKNAATLPASPLTFETNSTVRSANEFDLAKAGQLLDSAGWKIDQKTGLRSKKNIPFELTVATNDFLLNSKAAELLANQWRALNIKINLTVLPTKQLTDSLIRPRHFDVLVFPQKFGTDPDPFAFWHSSQIKDPGLNITGFSDPAADKLITESRTTLNNSTRQIKYAQLDKELTEKIPAFYLDETEYIYALDVNVKNINLHTLYDPSQRFYDIANWYIAEKRTWK